MIAYLSNIMFGIGASYLIFFICSFKKQRSRNAALFSIMCLAIAVFVIGYGFELRASDLEQIKFFLKVEYFGAPFMTVFWFLFSYKFYYNKNASFRLTFLMMIVPILTLFFSVTNDYHHFLYKSIAFSKYDTLSLAQLERGFWYYLYTLYSYALIAYGSILFFKIWRTTENKTKTQAFLMFSGTIAPVLLNIVYLVGIIPSGIDLTPFGLMYLVISYGLAIFKYDVFELQEIIKTTAFSEINDGILVIDEKNRLVDFNIAGTTLFSWMKRSSIGCDISKFEWGTEILKHEDEQFEIEMNDQGTEKDFEFRSTLLSEKKRNLGRVYFFRDITEQRKLIEKLNELASYDGLTQVYNRRKLFEEAEKEALRAERYYDSLSVLMIDIDHFKRVNDLHGHLAGDEVIQHVAMMIKETVRSIDIVGRYGGEEFVVILSNVHKDRAMKIAETIRKEIEEMETLHLDEDIKVTVSIGVASINNEHEHIDIAAVINLADEAMYNAKNNGRNQVW